MSAKLNESFNQMFSHLSETAAEAYSKAQAGQSNFKDLPPGEYVGKLLAGDSKSFAYGPDKSKWAVDLQFEVQVATQDPNLVGQTFGIAFFMEPLDNGDFPAASTFKAMYQWLLQKDAPDTLAEALKGILENGDGAPFNITVKKGKGTRVNYYVNGLAA